MENAIGGIVLAAVVATLVMSSPEDQAAYAAYAASPASKVQRRPATAAPTGQTQATTTDNRQVQAAATPEEVIGQVKVAYDVPAGLTYGVCKKESDCLNGGWSPDWSLATAVRDRECVAAGKSVTWCQEQWNALVAVCAQKRDDGSTVCDPTQVRTSWAFAMGPFQQLPATVLSLAKSDPSVDFDRDGAVDPHSFADGAAMAARYLRNEFDLRSSKVTWAEAWIQSANAYFGSQESGYFSGKWVKERDRRTNRPRKVWSKGVGEHWRDWCRVHRCKTV